MLDRVPVIQFSGNYDKSLAGGSNYEARATAANEFSVTSLTIMTFLNYNVEFDTGDALAFYQRGAE